MSAVQNAQPAPVVVELADPRIQQLHAMYRDAKAEADDAAKRLKAIVDALKGAAYAQAGENQPRIVIAAGAGPALSLDYRTSRRLDSKRLQREMPTLAESYMTESGSWYLNVIEGGDTE